MNQISALGEMVDLSFAQVSLNFSGLSYFSLCFRKGRFQHRALYELDKQLWQLHSGWIVNADITGLYDNLDHGHLRRFIRKRVNDGSIIRLLGKWLNAGVMEEGKLKYYQTGTPQGDVISPLLSNIFLH